MTLPPIRHASLVRGAPPLVMLLMLGTLAGIVRASPADAANMVLVVHRHGSIQKALDNAPAGSTVLVDAGEYAEQLTITTDGIRLIGQGARLVPPPQATTNTCSGIAGPEPGTGPPTQAGICVTGSHVSFDRFNSEHTPVHAVGRPIRSVRIAGFDVRGFSGPDVAVVGGSDVRVEHNHLAASPRYGVLSVGSRNTHVIDNSVTGGPVPGFFIGVCVDDKSGAEVRHNEVSGQIVALCIETPGTTVDANQVHDNCSGIFVEGVDAKVTGNHVYNNNECPELPAEQGIALTLAGSRGAVVRHNLFEGHTASVTGGAAVVITDGPTIATGNVVSRNQFRGNTLDLASFSAGRNRIDRNDCSSSIPEQLCS